MTIKSQDTAFTMRILMSLVCDVAAAKAAFADTVVKIEALAAIYDVKMVDPKTL